MADLVKDYVRYGVGCDFCADKHGDLPTIPTGGLTRICAQCMRDNHPEKSKEEFIEWWERQVGEPMRKQAKEALNL